MALAMTPRLPICRPRLASGNSSVGSAIHAGLIGLAVIGVLTSLVSAYYYLRVVVIMYMRAGEPEARSELWLSAAIAATAAATFFLGLVPQPLLELAVRAGLSVPLR
jgi:NADH-quinone oxidoreductase subunit N